MSSETSARRRRGRSQIGKNDVERKERLSLRNSAVRLNLLPRGLWDP